MDLKRRKKKKDTNTSTHQESGIYEREQVMDLERMKKNKYTNKTHKPRKRERKESQGGFLCKITPIFKQFLKLVMFLNYLAN